jgi:peptidoglycan/LPS O-acetylase OafA/YrhL
MSTNSARIPEIEGIRGILSILVITGHALPKAVPWFPACMDFFFVISGFLITRILLQAPTLSSAFFFRYGIRRILRIWPMYYVALIVYFLFVYLVASPEHFTWYGLSLDWKPSWQPILLSSIFLQNTEVLFGFPRISYPLLFGHSWSVAVEEQFYILWPIGFLAIRGASKSFGILLIVLVLVGVILFRGVSYLLQGDHGALWLLPGRMDSFALGIVLAFMIASRNFLDHETEIRRGLTLLAVAASLLLFPYVTIGYGLVEFEQSSGLAWTLFDPTLGSSLLAFSLVGLVIINSGAQLTQLLRLPLLMRLGTISYSTYLMHILALVIAQVVVEKSGFDNRVVIWALGVTLSLTISNLTYNLIEARALSLKRRFVLPVASAYPCEFVRNG